MKVSQQEIEDMDASLDDWADSQAGPNALKAASMLLWVIGAAVQDGKTREDVHRMVDAGWDATLLQDDV